VSSEGKIGSLAFLGVCIASFGGPLALAALAGPVLVTGTAASAGLVMVAAAVIFGLPLLLWLRYSRDIASAGGLYAFVEAAAGRPAALAQAGLWVVSYLLYVIYTPASIVYETLPVVWPGVTSYQPMLEIALPIALAVVLLTGRAVTLAVIGLVAVSQLVLVGYLAVVALRHDAPASAFAAHGSVSDLAGSSGRTALLYVCGSLPLFLGGEVARPTRTIRRCLLLAFAVVVTGVVAAVSPLADNPAFTQAAIPGVSMVRVFAGNRMSVVVGVGVAVSVAGVMLVELVALSRLLHAVTGRSVDTMVKALAGVLVVSGPLSLLDPQRLYDLLIKPSLLALWVSQLVVFLAFPLYLVRRGVLRPAHVGLAVGASTFAVYGFYVALTGASS
jgi:amino acid transporter